MIKTLRDGRGYCLSSLPDHPDRNTLNRWMVGVYLSVWMGES